MIKSLKIKVINFKKSRPAGNFSYHEIPAKDLQKLQRVQNCLQGL